MTTPNPNRIPLFPRSGPYYPLTAMPVPLNPSAPSTPSGGVRLIGGSVEPAGGMTWTAQITYYDEYGTYHYTAGQADDFYASAIARLGVYLLPSDQSEIVYVGYGGLFGSDLGNSGTHGPVSVTDLFSGRGASHPGSRAYEGGSVDPAEATVYVGYPPPILITQANQAMIAATGYWVDYILSGLRLGGGDPVVFGRDTALIVAATQYNNFVGIYNAQFLMAAGMYDAQARAINANPAVIDPVGFTTTAVNGLRDTVLAQVTAALKLVTDTATAALKIVNDFKVNTVDPAVAGAITTVNGAVATAQAIAAKAQSDVLILLQNTGTEVNARLKQAQDEIALLDDKVLAEAGKVQAEVNRLKTTTVDPLVGNAIGTVTGALTTVTTIVTNTRAEVDRIVASAPGEIDNRVDQVEAAIASTMTTINNVRAGAEAEAGRIKTGTVDPVVATAMRVIGEQTAAVGPIVTDATNRATAALSNAQAEVGRQEAVLRAEAQKQQQAAEKTVTDAQTYAMGQIANVTAIALATVGQVTTLVGQVTGTATAEILRVVGLVTAQTVDRPLFYGTLSSPVTIGAATDVVVIPPGGLTITAD